ncbi:zf-HC2 domain-containing protein [Priestia flexa]|uniref:anti-sigma factor family protein n=1 Tax=Priestia flexa TaxID=86664 RepID=UPI00240DF374|nr:anti-sigma factor [Priestia flexa]WEZ08687.1 anti-sigma factor [Priestia flexa]
MKCSSSYVNLIHEYLDGDLTKENEQLLKQHLQECDACQEHFKQLKRTIAFVQSTSHIDTPMNFTANIMAGLPKEKSAVRMNRWFTNHPFLTAAAVFTLLMSGATFSAWNTNEEFAVSKQDNLVIENKTVIVPAGEVVKGDVTVRNGDIKVEGTVDGNITVINGDQYLASAGKVTGDIEELDQMFEWIWYNVKNGVKDAVNLSNNE